jgi:small-conductance mechanosensitive channel
MRAILRPLAIVASLLLPSTLAAQGLGDALNGPVDNAAEPAPPSSSISTPVDPSIDEDIRSRLDGIYGELPRLEKVNVVVSNGVVSLSGTLLSADALNEAAELAARVEGIVDVDNQLTIETDLTERLDNSLSELKTESRTFLSSLPLYLLSLGIVVLSWLAGRWASTKHGWLRHLTPNQFIAELLGNIIWMFILTAGLFLALRLIDATHVIGTVLGAAGIIGLAVGFAVRDTVENYIASILLSLRNPFKTRDYVSIEGYEGSVARLTSRATILVSADGNHIRIPNAIVYKSVITNFSRNPLRRFEFEVGIDSEDDISNAQQHALNALSAISSVLNDPSASVTVSKLGDSNTTLLIRAWMNQTEYDLLKVRSESIRLVKTSFDDAGIVMPEPIYRLNVSDASKQNTQPELDRIPQRKPTIIRSAKQAQSVTAEDTADVSISAELAAADSENLLSDTTAHE